MEGYLGETPVDISKSEFKNYTPADWAMYFIERYGQIDGDHHKAWVLDQVSRILKGTPIIVKLARWSNDHFEYRITTGDQSKEYAKWVLDMKHSEDDDEEFGYEEGIAP